MDDIVVKSKRVKDLEKMFGILKKYDMKLNL